jgi:hypothetical protein
LDKTDDNEMTEESMSSDRIDCTEKETQSMVSSKAGDGTEKSGL